jgi:hypothetical protein
MNDDIFMLADQSPADFALAGDLGEMSHRLGETMAAMNQWRRNLGQVLMRCYHHGRGTFNFSTHTPYLYRRDLAREVLERFGVMWKLPFETAYHNWHRTPHSPLSGKAAGPHDLAANRWINPSFRQVTEAFRAELAFRFGMPDCKDPQERRNQAAPVALNTVPQPPPPPITCMNCGRK